jgi:hypothetical protein
MCDARASAVELEEKLEGEEPLTKREESEP